MNLTGFLVFERTTGKSSNLWKKNKPFMSLVDPGFIKNLKDAVYYFDENIDGRWEEQKDELVQK